MTKRVSRRSQITAIKRDETPTRRFLWFELPEELRIGDTFHENHKSVLEGSKRRKEEIRAAGFIGFARDHLMIDANGSSGLEIEATDSTSVKRYVEALP